MMLVEAQSIAQYLVDQLQPAAEFISVAGSVRRLKADVHDLEIVIQPILEAEPVMFGDPAYSPIRMLDVLSCLVRTGALEYDREKPRNGEKYKRFVAHVGEASIALDLFIADSDNLGNIFAIRTGDGFFSQLLVTPRNVGGLMPSNLRQRGGYLWHGDTLLECPDEATFFGHLGLAVISPDQRNAEMASRMARMVRA